MRSAPFLRPSNPNNGPLRRRALTLLLVLGIHLLLLVMLLRLAPPPSPPPTGSAPITVSLLPESKAPAAHAAPQPPRRRRAPSPASAARPPAPLPPSAIWSQVVPLTRRELAAADIAGIRSAVPPAEGHGESGTAHGHDALAGASGGGPGGQQLYDADWYRKPTNAELATYLPAGAPRAGWGMVACQTVAGYRVEDCREIAQSPAGSGLARAVREASWQFRVLPPRINGRPIIGAWVRIRIEYSERGELHAG